MLYQLSYPIPVKHVLIIPPVYPGGLEPLSSQYLAIAMLVFFYIKFHVTTTPLSMVILAADQRHHYLGHPLVETNYTFVGNGNDVDTGHPGEAYY